MDTFTLIAADSVVKLGGIREAARRLACPSSTVSAAFSRLEGRLAIRIAERTGARFVLTLEGRRMAHTLAAAATVATQLQGLAPVGAAASLPVPLQTLVRFIQVARSGSVRRAAQVIGIGQPQLSRQLSGLEKRIGVTLFRRSVEGLELTAAGADLLTLAEELTDLWQSLSGKASDRFRRSLSTVRLGAIMPLGHESATARLLAKLAARWHVSGSRTRLFISSTVAQELLTGLQKGTFDIAILDTTPDQSNLECRKISQSPLVLVSHKRFFSAFGDDIGQLLTCVPLAASSLKSGLRQKLEEVLDRYLSVAQKEKLKILEIDSLPAILNLVIDYGFASILPRASIDPLMHELHHWDIGAEFDLDLTLAWPATPTSRRAAEMTMSILES